MRPMPMKEIFDLYVSDEVILVVLLLLTTCIVHRFLFAHPIRFTATIGFLTLGLMASSRFFGHMPVSPVQFRQFIGQLRLGAHRGLADDAPENTIEAFRVSKHYGADSVEFDVSFTKDGVAVLMHDETVDRTTNGTGLISEMTYEQVRTLNAAAKFRGEYYSFVRVPTLTEAVEYCLGKNLRMFFDIKSFQSELAPTFAKLFKEHKDLYSMGAVCSFDPRVPFAIKRADPNIIVGLTWRPYFLSNEDVFMNTRRYAYWAYYTTARVSEAIHIWNLHHWLWKVAGVQLILAHQSVVNPAYVRKWRQRGVEVVAWTVNDYPQRVFLYKTLKCAFLTDKLSDFQYDIEDDNLENHRK